MIRVNFNILSPPRPPNEKKTQRMIVILESNLKFLDFVKYSKKAEY